MARLARFEGPGTCEVRSIGPCSVLDDSRDSHDSHIHMGVFFLGTFLGLVKKEACGNTTLFGCPQLIIIKTKTI